MGALWRCAEEGATAEVAGEDEVATADGIEGVQEGLEEVAEAELGGRRLSADKAVEAVGDGTEGGGGSGRVV